MIKSYKLSWSYVLSLKLELLLFTTNVSYSETKKPGKQWVVWDNIVLYMVASKSETYFTLYIKIKLHFSLGIHLKFLNFLNISKVSWLLHISYEMNSCCIRIILKNASAILQHDYIFLCFALLCYLDMLYYAYDNSSAIIVHLLFYCRH